MNTKEGKQLYKEVKLLFKDTPFYVSDDSDEYDWDDIHIGLNIRDGAAGLMSIFKVNMAQIYKNLVKIVKKYPDFKMVGADQGGGDFYDDNDTIRFIEIYGKEYDYDEDDDLSESFVDKFNGYANLNEMAVFRPYPLKNNIQEFKEALLYKELYETYINDTNNFNDAKKLISLLFVSDKNSDDKIHIIMYFTDVINDNDNPFESLVGKSDKDLARHLRTIWEREPSYLLYGGYISAKNLPDFNITDEKVLNNFISKTKVFNNLTKYISRGYYQFNGFKKGHLTINAENLL